MKRECETVAPGGGEFVGQALVEISLTIQVGIVQSRQLISPNHMDSIIDHDQSERLVQTGCESFPNQPLELFIDSIHNPDVSHQGAHRNASV